MSTSPLLSVVIPVYNGERYVKACLDMMFAQTYTNLEVIVVNDGSSDNSLSIAEQYPVKIVDHPTNMGLAASRNDGIEVAQGKYLHFMDVDDRISEDYYQRMIEALETTGASTACGGFITEGNKGRSLLYKHNHVYRSVEQKMEVTMAPKWGYVVRYVFTTKELQQSGIRFEKGRFIEDLPFTVRMIYHTNSVVTVPQTAYYYAQHPQSIMHKRDKAHVMKKRADKQYAQQWIKDFAHEKGFRLYGVNNKRWHYIWGKIYRTLFGYKS